MKQRFWILVAHRAGARLFEQSGRGQPLRLVESIDHPEGRLRKHDLDADTGGRAFDRMGEHRHAVEPEHSATEHLAESFAKSLAVRLRQGREAGAFDQAVVVADPRSLGLIRGALDSFTAAVVERTLDKDLGNLPDDEVTRYLTNAFKL